MVCLDAGCWMPVVGSRAESNEAPCAPIASVIWNVYGTFNFIWIITICFRRLAQKCLAVAYLLLSPSISPSLSLSESVLPLSFSVFFLMLHLLRLSPEQWAMKWVGVACAWAFIRHSGARISLLLPKCNCEFQTNVKFEFTSLTFLVTSKIICLVCLQTQSFPLRVCERVCECGCECWMRSW